MKDLKEAILKYAVQNAMKFNGKANPGAVIGKVLSEDPSLKTKMKEISKDIQDIVKKVNGMSKARLEEEFKKHEKDIPKKKQEEKGLKELKNIKGKVVMRFAPSPSGPMHLGHAYGISLSSEYCRKYKGKFILRIEDTNPENIYEPAYGMLPEDAKWITKDNVKEVMIQSDNLGKYYDYAEKLVDMGKAYICDCDPDIFRELIFEKKACPCRGLSVKEQQERYAKMFGEYKPGEVVLRIKTDVAHKNPAMRDFPLMRINDHKHPRQDTKYRVWPLMNLAVFVDDLESGMTHIIRAKEHMSNGERQKFLYQYFDKPIPEMYYVGRINFSDLRISCSKTKVLIEEGKYEDWSDIRLPFLVALKRRGYQPEAFIKYAVDVGLTQNDKTVSKDEFFKALDHNNKEALDAKTNRYFFVKDPKKILVYDSPHQTVEIDLHPDFPKKGKRKFETRNKFFVASEDLKNIKDVTRLMDCLNFKKKGDKYYFDSLEYDKDKIKSIIHWIPYDSKYVNVEILMPDNKVVKGYAEEGVGKLKEGDIVQFERVGFCRLDSKEKDRLKFWFGHR